MMNQFTQLATKRPNLARALVFGYTLWNGIWLFPLRLSAEFSELLLYAITIYVYWMLGALLLGLYPDKADRGIVLVFGCHGLGLLLRVVLEWGEASMIRDLTTFNVAVYLLAVPLLVYLSYRSNQKRQG